MLWMWMLWPDCCQCYACGCGCCRPRYMPPPPVMTPVVQPAIVETPVIQPVVLPPPRVPPPLFWYYYLSQKNIIFNELLNIQLINENNK